MTETSIVGEVLDLVVGAVAHGGHCVSRAPDGRVVFVRHALPGEKVRAEVTEERRGYLRADAIEVVEASPDRVTPPCPYAGPGRCGGCDFQHATPAAQRDLKRAVIVEQLARLGRLSAEEIDRLGVRVEELPGGALGWRTRLRYTVDADGHAGLLKHRSHEVVPVSSCAIAEPAIRTAAVPGGRTVTAADWPDADEIDVAVSSTGEVAITAVADGRQWPVTGPRRLHETLSVGPEDAPRVWELPPTAFWQVHAAAAQTFVSVAMEMLAPAPGERAWDLYGGAGSFAAALGARVGSSGSVLMVESDSRAVVAASEALADMPWIRLIANRVEVAGKELHRQRPDVVVLDPPRSGAGARVVRMLVEASPRAIAYVACDPAAFARDVATFREAGWHLSTLRVFDAFPMTHHVECIALLTP